MGDWLSTIHFSVWFAFAAIFYLSNEFDRMFGLSILVIPLVATPGLIAITTSLIGLIANVGARSWKKLVSVVGAPVLALSLLTALIHYRIDFDWLRFQATQAHYSRLARQLPGPSPRYHKWSWGSVGGAAVANIFYTLVYDETDRPLDRPTSSGQERATFSSRSYGNHFFLVTELYQ
ncbi:hypothetical protein JOE11_002339 [Robbsia andropogonis]